jgi:nucleotide-binding universal stress UspA family protein
MAAAPLFVVPVDFGPEMETTVSLAFALAERCDARVHLLQVVPPPALAGDRADFRASGRTTPTGDWSRLETSMEAAAGADIDVRVVAYRGDPIKIAASYAQLTKARLLVIGRHYGTSRWRRSARIVSTLSRVAPAPVLVVPPGHRAANSRPLFAHIVSAVDFTVASAVAVRTVMGLTRRTGARLTLVHVVKEGTHPMVFSGSEAGRIARSLKGQLGEAARQLRSRIPAAAGLRVDARVTSGDAHHGLLDIAADVNADLIVMGVSPRTRFDELLSGSRLRRVLRRADIPVLVVPVPAGAYEWLEEPAAVAAASRRSRERRA